MKTIILKLLFSSHLFDIAGIKERLSRFLMILIFIFIIGNVSAQPQLRFAAFGDGGVNTSLSDKVGNLVNSRDTINGHAVDTNYIVILLGDYNYELGEQSTLDINVGKNYSRYIYPYNRAGFAPGFPPGGNNTKVNRLFRAIGNHELYSDPKYSDYLYFELPNVKKLNTDNQGVRYYSVRKGDVEFFFVNSGTGDNEFFRTEPDGVDSNSIQAQRIKAAMLNSTAKWKIVCMHYPPFCSWCDVASNRIFRWNFKGWGANLILTGHSHFYERLSIDGLTYVVSGLGGYHSIGGFGQTWLGSQIRYDGNQGVLFGDVYKDSLVFKFINTNKSIIDYFRISNQTSQIISLNMKMFIQGLYNINTQKMIQRDTIIIYLRSGTPPYNKIDSAKNIINVSGNGTFVFNNVVNNTNYFIEINHRNSLETWSAHTEVFVNGILNFDITINKTEIFGNNMVRVGNNFAIFSGDVNKDGIIDIEDIMSVYNGASYGDQKIFNRVLSGEISVKTARSLKVKMPIVSDPIDSPMGSTSIYNWQYDINNDGIIDLTDLLIVYQNSINCIERIIP